MKTVNQAGRLGGLKTLERYGVDHFKRMSQLALKAKSVRKRPIGNSPLTTKRLVV